MHKRDVQGMVLYAAGRTSTYPEDPPASGFRFHYLGGGDEVGNVGLVLEDASEHAFFWIALHRHLHPAIHPKHRWFTTQ